MTCIKICGITDTQQALVAAQAGADFLGLVFAPSRRRIITVKATEIIKTVRLLKSPPSITGVFVNSPADEVNSIATLNRLDWVQLSGDETWDYCRNIKAPIIKVIHISVDSTTQEVAAKIEEGYRLIPGDRLKYLLDAHVPGSYGGTGQSFNWALAKNISSRFPVIIAGGLTPQNIGRMVSEVQPWGVDVSSGVETGGQKDISKIKEFIHNAKSFNAVNKTG